MKFIIADIASACFPEDVTLGRYDAAAAARIQARVMAQIKTDGRRRKYTAKKIIRILALAAVFVALFTATACALGLFALDRREPANGERIRGSWMEEDAYGKSFEVGMYYDEAGMVFTYECESTPHLIRFKPHWLPSSPTALPIGEPDEEGWYRLCGDWSDDGTGAIPYLIGVFYAVPDFQLVLNGEVTLLREEYWGGLAVTELKVEWDGHGKENYILLFSEENGYLLRIGGAEDMETLEHIARELEIDVTDELHEHDPDFNIGIMNIGRG